jgi:glucan phosphoethanolaminetransferase (alkaline phosphatase superfamily)
MLYVLIGIVVLTFTLLLIIRKKVISSLKSTLIVSAITILLGFSLSSIFTAFFLMINRTKTTITVTKEYEVMNSFLIELKTGKHIDFEELEPFLSRKQTEEFEKKKYIKLKFKRGLLDIDFLEKK